MSADLWTCPTCTFAFVVNPNQQPPEGDPVCPECELRQTDDDYAQALCELTEAQHALVLLADQLERHGVPFVPEAEAATAAARAEQEAARRMDERGKAVIADVFAKQRAAADPTCAACGRPRSEHFTSTAMPGWFCDRNRLVYFTPARPAPEAA